MASFRYKAVNGTGALVKGVVVADTPADARDRLRHMRLFPERIEPTRGAAETFSGGLPGSRARAQQEVATFTRQAAVLLKSGVPIVEALGVLAQQVEHRRLSEALLEIRESVNAGSSFAEALAGYPRFFDRYYVETVSSGEKSGAMDTVFERLSEFLERRHLMHAKVATALIYPAVLVLMAVGLLVFLSAVVVPMLRPLLAQHRGGLPLSTEILFGLSDFVRRFGWLAVPILLAAALSMGVARRFAPVRRWLDRRLLRLPLIGGLIRKSLVSRFCMSFSTLLRTGVPALEALETLADLMPNAAFAEEVGRIRADVVEGKDISSRMRRGGLFPPTVGYMVSVGERSGNLAEVLEHVSSAYDVEVEIASRRLLAVLEPALVIVMAVVVGYIAVSLMITILQLNQI